MQIRLKQDTPIENRQGVFVVIPANTLLTPTWYNTFIDGNGEWFEFRHHEHLYTTLLAIHVEKVYPRPAYWSMTRSDGLATCMHDISKTLNSLSSTDTNLTTDMRDTALIEAYQHMQYVSLQMYDFANQYPLPPIKEEQG